MRSHWTPAEVSLLRSMYPECHTADVAALLGKTLPAVYNQAFMSGLKKSAEYLASDTACRGQKGRADQRLRASQFTKGFTPWNKGRKGVNGVSATRFRKGNMPQTWRPVGSIRIERDGPMVKISDTRNKAVDWRPVRELVWESANGAIPAGRIVTFKPGMHTNSPDQITADKLELVDRAELARRNHPSVRNPEIARLIQLKGAITRQVNRIAREAQEKA